MPTKLSQEDILESISTMTVLELSELLKAFEDRFGVTAAPAAVAAGRPAPAAPPRRSRWSRSRKSSTSC